MSGFERINENVKVPPRRRINLADFEPKGALAPIDEADLVTFLENLCDTGSEILAAVNMGRAAIEFEAVRSENPTFAKAWSYAMKMSAEYLDAEARRRAIEGNIRDIIHKGEVVGSYTEYSDTLLVAMLKAKHPSYGGIDANASGMGGPVTIQINPVPSGHYVPQADPGLGTTV